MSQSWTLIIATVGASTGLLGAVLGVINTWANLNRDRVRLLVIPKIYRPLQDGVHIISSSNIPANADSVCVEVVNVGFHSVTVDEVGFVGSNKKTRFAILQPHLIDGGSFPRRLEPRSSFTAYSAPGALLKMKDRFDRAFASTECGRTFSGRSKALKTFLGQP